MLSAFFQYLSLAILAAIACCSFLEVARLVRRYFVDRRADALRIAQLIQEIESAQQHVAARTTEREVAQPPATVVESNVSERYPAPTSASTVSPDVYSVAQQSEPVNAVRPKPSHLDQPQIKPVSLSKSPPVAWEGTRQFRVVRKVAECTDCHSIYMIPLDGQSLPLYLPGQYLTFSLPVPGQPKPIVRCYSLSDEPSADFYRCTAKKVPAPDTQPDVPAGLASSYVNDALKVGDVLDVRAPRGGFFLDVFSDLPVVLVAGGIGVTPLLSMLNTLMTTRFAGPVHLFYGVRNSAEHAFRRHLSRLAEQHHNFTLTTAYSRPLALDQQGRDFEVAGRLDADTVRRGVGSPHADFYLCGPGTFMESIVTGLIEWGVDAARIRYESFGPSSLAVVPKPAVTTMPSHQVANVTIRFERSGKTVTWDGSAATLLDLAQQHGVPISYGCRAGNCGTCATAVRAGSVEYADDAEADCDADCCLPCVCTPAESLVLDA